MITTSGTPVAGQPYTMTCSIPVNGSIEWLGLDGTPILNISGITIEKNIRTKGWNSHSLVFDQISLMDSGMYICKSGVGLRGMSVSVKGVLCKIFMTASCHCSWTCT